MFLCVMWRSEKFLEQTCSNCFWPQGISSLWCPASLELLVGCGVCTLNLLKLLSEEVSDFVCVWCCPLEWLLPLMGHGSHLWSGSYYRTYSSCSGYRVTPSVVACSHQVLPSNELSSQGGLQIQRKRKSMGKGCVWPVWLSGKTLSSCPPTGTSKVHLFTDQILIRKADF